MAARDAAGVATPEFGTVGILPLGRPTFDVPYAEERLGEMLAALAAAGAKLAGPRGLLFDATKRLLEIADDRVALQVEARCWCGQRATHNARLVNGRVVYEGETVVVGDTEDEPEQPLFGDVVRYELLCRRHYATGALG